MEVSTPRWYDKWRKIDVLFREYKKNISNLGFKMYTMSLSNVDGMKI